MPPRFAYHRAMFRMKSRPTWLIDPDRVEYAALSDAGGASRSRTHVSLKSAGDPCTRLVPVETFLASASAALAAGRPLAVEHLRVAPILWSRHRGVLDRLTDWTPAFHRARSRRSPQLPL